MGWRVATPYKGRVKIIWILLGCAYVFDYICCGWLILWVICVLWVMRSVFCECSLWKQVGLPFPPHLCTKVQIVLNGHEFWSSIRSAISGQPWFSTTYLNTPLQNLEHSVYHLITFSRSLVNFFSSIGLVRISAHWSTMLTLLNMMLPDSTSCQKWWYLMFMSWVWDCNFGV